MSLSVNQTLQSPLWHPLPPKHQTNPLITTMAPLHQTNPPITTMAPTTTQHQTKSLSTGSNMISYSCNICNKVFGHREVVFTNIALHVIQRRQSLAKLNAKNRDAPSLVEYASFSNIFRKITISKWNLKITHSQVVKVDYY